MRGPTTVAFAVMRSPYGSAEAAALTFASRDPEWIDLLVRCFAVGQYFHWCIHEGRAELEKLEWYQQQVPWHQHLARVVLGSDHVGVYELSWQCQGDLGTYGLEDRLSDLTRNRELVVTVFALFAFALDRRPLPTAREMLLMSISLGWQSPLDPSVSAHARRARRLDLRNVWERRIATVWKTVGITVRAGVYRCHGRKRPKRNPPTGPRGFALSKRQLKKKASVARAARKGIGSKRRERKGVQTT